jgi:hypothetical protein
MEGFNDVWANILNDDILKIHDSTFRNMAAVIDKDGVTNLNMVSHIEDEVGLKKKIKMYMNNPLDKEDKSMFMNED